jgi:hypothetical protein
MRSGGTPRWCRSRGAGQAIKQPSVRLRLSAHRR